MKRLSQSELARLSRRQLEQLLAAALSELSQLQPATATQADLLALVADVRSVLADSHHRLVRNWLAP